MPTNPNASSGAGRGVPIGGRGGDTVNPNATPGAGRGRPISGREPRVSAGARAQRQAEVSIPDLWDESLPPDAFMPLSARVSGDSLRTRIQTGWVEEIIPQAEVDSVVEHAVQYAGATVTEETEIPMDDGDTLCVKVTRTNVGGVSTEEGKTPVYEAHATVPESSHWYPPDPQDSEGAEGVEYYKLFRISLTGGAPEVTPYHYGPIQCKVDLWVGRNDPAQSGSVVFQQHKEDEGAVFIFNRIIGIAPVSVTQEAGGQIKVELTGGGEDLNLHITTLNYLWNATLHVDVVVMCQANDTETTVTYYWRGGLYVGSSDDDPDDYAADGLGTDAYATYLNYQG